MSRRHLLVTLAACAAAAAAPIGASAQSNKGDVRIALIASKSGPLEAYAKQTIVGFRMGLDYATQGTLTVAGRKLVVIEKDDQGKPDVGKAQLAAAYADDKADIAVGPTASPVALAMLPVAEEYKKILPGRAGGGRLDHRRQVEQVHLPHASQTAARTPAANAVALDAPGHVVGTLAQDNAFGRDGRPKAFKEYLTKAKLCTRSSSGRHRRLHRRLATHRRRDEGQAGTQAGSGWSGPAPDAVFQVRRARAEAALRDRDGHRRQHPAGDGRLQAVSRHGGALYYYFAIRRTRSNAWLVDHYKQFKTPPDFHRRRHERGDRRRRRAEQTGATHSTNKLIAAMGRIVVRDAEGKMDLRKQDTRRQSSTTSASNRPAFAWGVPELVREIKAEEMKSRCATA